MVKKLLTLALGLLCMVGLSAQTETTIAISDVVNWTGNGTKKAVLVVEFDTVAYAWGYQFETEATTPTVLNMITAIDAADPRLAYSMDWNTFAMKFYYVAWPEKHIDSNYRFKVNGVIADVDDEFSDYDLEDGLMVKVSMATSAVWSQPIRPASAVSMPENSTIAPEQIRYWVGSGAKQAIVAINWGVPDTALAWGIRFDSAMTIAKAITMAAGADPRLTVNSTISTIEWNDGTSSWSFHAFPASYVQFILGNNSNVNANSEVKDGDVLKVGESAYGIGIDSTEYAGMWYPMSVVWNAPIQAVDNPDAEIAASDIVYWVGEGSNSVVMAVNWADTALAWGYHFSADSVTVQVVLDAIAEADPRFSIVVSGGYLTDIRFALSATDTLSVTPGNFFESTRNHVSDAGLWQKLANGDFEKWADPAAGVIIDSMSYTYGENTYWFYTRVYMMPIMPVSQPGNSGIAGVQPVEVSIWPNPASEVINVKFGSAVGATEMAVYDITGRMVSRQAVAMGSTSASIAVSQLPQGTYLLRIGQNTSKVVVRH